MPELPEVETVRRTIQRALGGQKIVDAEVAPDSIVLQKADHLSLQKWLLGKEVLGVGRKGKTFWLEFGGEGFLYGHLGMAGWVREIGKESIRLREHGNAPWEDENGRARFLKLRIRGESGGEIVFTDGRRLARIWRGESPDIEPKTCALGPDCWNDAADAAEIIRRLSNRTAPMKAALLDQTLFAGVGNWIADEVLFHAKISPHRPAKSLTLREAGELAKALHQILESAIEVGANSEKYPESWLFHVRWGGKRGKDEILGLPLVRETVGGRTTAWVPGIQK